MNSTPQTTLQTSTEFSIALTTAASRADADQLAFQLVEAGLAACVNIIDGVGSVYRWQGKVHSCAEVILIIKLRTSDAALVHQSIATFHTKNVATEPYDLPEFILIPITAGSAAYLDWLDQCRKP